MRIRFEADVATCALTETWEVDVSREEWEAMDDAARIDYVNDRLSKGEATFVRQSTAEESDRTVQEDSLREGSSHVQGT